MQLNVIGYLHSPIKQKFGAPRQPGLVDVQGRVKFNAPYADPAAFEGIEQFSHLWLIWQFHANSVDTQFRPQVRPPRLGGNRKIGVFATRSMFRANPLGLSVVRLVRAEVVSGSVELVVSGADLIDGTPIYDVKPYLPYSDQIGSATAKGFSAPGVVEVSWSPNALEQLGALGLVSDREQIEGLIAQDPRPAYQGVKELGDPVNPRLYGLRWRECEVRFQASGSGLLIAALEPVSE